jgi:hypothetical protein
VTGVLYASLPELKQQLAIADEANDVDLERALESASRWIEGYTGRVFTLQTAQTRYYYPQDAERVDVVDLVAVTTLSVDSVGDRTYSTSLAASDYELWPLDGPPYDQIRIWPLSSSRSFSPGRRVRVVGSFGCVVDGAAPVAVKQACLILAGRYYVRKDAPFGVLSAVDLGQFERISKEDPDVVSLLGPWRLNAAWILV